MLFRSRSGGEKGLRGSGAGTLGVPLEGTRRVGDVTDFDGQKNLLFMSLNDDGALSQLPHRTPGAPLTHQLR